MIKCKTCGNQISPENITLEDEQKFCSDCYSAAISWHTLKAREEAETAYHNEKKSGEPISFDNLAIYDSFDLLD